MQSARLGQYLGNALNAFRATPGYRLVKADTPDDMFPYLIHLSYEQGYARWPVNVPRYAKQAEVEGKCEVRYEVFKNGKRIARGHLEAEPPPFKVPLNLIRQDNVKKMVQDSLGHQFMKSTTDVLDELMMELADLWPKYAGKANAR